MDLAWGEARRDLDQRGLELGRESLRGLFIMRPGARAGESQGRKARP
jgi:hypothetical protein